MEDIIMKYHWINFKEICLQLRVFADDVVESSEVTTGITKIGDYELHDLVLLEYALLFSKLKSLSFVSVKSRLIFTYYLAAVTIALV